MPVRFGVVAARSSQQHQQSFAVKIMSPTQSTICEGFSENSHELGIQGAALLLRKQLLQV